MSSKRIEELEREIKEYRSQNRRADIRPLLNRALDAAADDEDRADILGRLVSEWQLAISGVPYSEEHRQEFEVVETMIKKCIGLKPDDAYNWIMLTEHFHYGTSELPKALEAVNTAIEKAEAEKAFVRQAHGIRIRISLALGKFDLVEDSLATLVVYEPSPENPDVALETDFLARISPGSVNEDLLARYRARSTIKPRSQNENE
jgi:cation transport regulator ChaB